MLKALLLSVVKGKMLKFYEEVKRLLKTLSDFNFSLFLDRGLESVAELGYLERGGGWK